MYIIPSTWDKKGPRVETGDCLGQECGVCPIGPYGIPDCPDDPAGPPIEVPEWKYPEGPIGLMPATPERFRRYLAYHFIEYRYDTRAMKQQVRFEWDRWIDLTDSVASIVQETLSTKPYPLYDNSTGLPSPVGGLGLELTDKSFNELIINACAHNAYDPLAAWLDDLPRWDRGQRLKYWLESCFEVAEESLELADWASQFIFLGCVWRAFQPGTKLDEMPILLGSPGIGKSTVLRYALPEEHRYMFTDGLNLPAAAKEKVESLQGRAIVEAAEMSGARKADLESLKAFLSRTDDGSIRLAFRKNPEPMPRRCILVGTADRSDPLPDDRNLRRYVPVTLLSGNAGECMKYMDENRMQIWAEAVHLYRQGVSARLPDNLKYLQAQATEAARAHDTVLEDAIAEWLPTAPQLFTIKNVALAVGLAEFHNPGKISGRDERRIAAVLRHCGYNNPTIEVDGKKLRRWTKAS